MIVVLDEVADAERDPLSGAFGHRMLGTTAEETEAAQWLASRVLWRSDVET